MKKKKIENSNFWYFILPMFIIVVLVYVSFADKLGLITNANKSQLEALGAILSAVLAILNLILIVQVDRRRQIDNDERERRQKEDNDLRDKRALLTSIHSTVIREKLDKLFVSRDIEQKTYRIVKKYCNLLCELLNYEEYDVVDNNLLYTYEIHIKYLCDIKNKILNDFNDDIIVIKKYYYELTLLYSYNSKILNYISLSENLFFEIINISIEESNLKFIYDSSVYNNIKVEHDLIIKLNIPPGVHFFESNKYLDIVKNLMQKDLHNPSFISDTP